MAARSKGSYFPDTLFGVSDSDPIKTTLHKMHGRIVYEHLIVSLLTVRAWCCAAHSPIAMRTFLHSHIAMTTFLHSHIALFRLEATLWLGCPLPQSLPLFQL